MSNVTPLPHKPRAPQSRTLTFRGAYGQPGGDGLDSLARLLLTLAADEDPQPISPPQPCRLLPAQLQRWEIHYKLYTGVKLASPRGSHDAPVTLVRRGPLPERRAA